MVWFKHGAVISTTLGDDGCIYSTWSPYIFTSPSNHYMPNNQCDFIWKQFGRIDKLIILGYGYKMKLKWDLIKLLFIIDTIWLDKYLIYSFYWSFFS